jgi:multiple sugar transport system substrate-binding protein
MRSSDDERRLEEQDLHTRSELIKRAEALGVTLTGLGMFPGAAAARALQGSASVNLNVWKAPHSATDAQFFNGQFKTYEKTNPGVSVDYRVTPWASWDQTYTSAFASGSPPDLHYDVPIYFGKFAKAGKLVALDQKYGSQLKTVAKNYDPTQFAGSLLGGHQYGLPFIGAGISFVWNKKLFKAAGLDPNTPPKTWAQVQAYAKKLTNPSTGVYGYAIMDDTTGEMINFYPSIMWNYGGKMVDSTGKWVFDDAKAQAGLNVLVDMYKAGYMPKFGTFVGHDLDTAFLEGKVAMQLSYSSFLIPLLPKYPGFQMGVSSTPAGPANSYSLGGSGFWAIATASKNPDAAWELAQFICTPSVMAAYCRLTSLFPARKDVHPFPAGSLLAQFSTTQKNYFPDPHLTIGYSTILSPQVQQAISGQVSTASALTTAADQINRELGK